MLVASAPLFSFTFLSRHVIQDGLKHYPPLENKFSSSESISLLFKIPRHFPVFTLTVATLNTVHVLSNDMPKRHAAFPSVIRGASSLWSGAGLSASTIENPCDAVLGEITLRTPGYE